MAHQLSIRANKFAEFAATKRQPVWHGLGQEMPEGASIETWLTQAGMDWSVDSSPVMFQGHNAARPETFSDKRVLFRSDTNEALSVVSDKFKVVQPFEVLEFFRDLTEFHGMKLSTAGTLFGGKRFWALAETGFDSDVVTGDRMKAHVMLVTSCDGSLATTAKFVSTRIVCANTLAVAMAEKSKQIIKVSHKSDFDASKVKIDMGLVEKSWYEFMTKLRSLTEVKMSDDQNRSFLMQNLIKDTDEPTKMELNTIESILSLAKNGLGSEFGTGTAWNTLNGITEHMTHFPNSKNSEVNFWNDISGNKDEIKSDLFQKLLVLA